MTRLLLTLLLCWFGASAGVAPQEPGSPTFAAFDVFVDSGNKALGAWQFEWVVKAGNAKIVGVEGGAAAAFAQAPYYDPAALQSGRIVIAAFSTQKDLPVGRTRIARVHLLIGSGASPQFEVQLHACADGQGEPLAATVAWQKMESK
ncbi:MAG TPA: hypothetical protein VF384_14370 [Planctomycetota bacterium]